MRTPTRTPTSTREQYEADDPERGYDEVGVGTQGAALILELRRLQVALDQNLHESTPRRHAQPPPRGRRRAREPGYRRAGMWERVLGRCLEQFGFAARPHPAHQRTIVAPTPTRRDASALRARPQPRVREPEVIQAAPVRSTAPRTAPPTATPPARPERAPASARVEYRPLAPPHQPPATTRQNAGVSAQIAVAARQLSTFGRFLLARARPDANDETARALGTRLDRALTGELRTGLRVLVAAGGLLGGWATLVPMSGAVVAPGVLVVESQVKKVQHPSGGIVASINVKDGSHVAMGDLLLRLDQTQARANNQMLTKQLEQIQMRIARLIAERDGATEVALPHSLAGRSDDDSIGELLASERSLFKARAVTRNSQRELLQSHVQQLREQIIGLDAQAKSKTAQINLISHELAGVEDLYAKGLSTITRLAGLQREAARLDGERGQIVSAIAEAKSKISETELQLLRVDQDFRAEVMKDLREAQDKEGELVERSVAASDLLRRVDIRAPAAGLVHELAVHTIGGVIAPGEMIMEIVPDGDQLVIEARLPPQDIDQVKQGQATHVRLSAFNQRTTPQLVGHVSYVSPDLSHDKQSNATYYTVRVTLPASERRRAGDLQLMSGMPAEVFLQTGSRTFLSYLFKPITDQLARTFNER